jgi:rod shape determining protein RodA
MRLPTSWRRFDFALFSTVIALACCSLVLVYSASHQSAVLAHLVWKQLLWLGVGLLAMSFFYILDYQSLIHSAYLFLGVILLLLVLLLLLGKSRGGSARWFHLGFFYFQPSELAKLVLILAVTRYVSENNREIRSFWGILPALGIAFLMMVLILRQPDLGTAAVFLPICFAILYVAGARAWHLLGLIFLGAASMPVLWNFVLKDYQKRRWLSFIAPENDALGSGYNAIQSGIAIGSGGVTGKGFLQGTQSQLNFVPMHHSDFIFSVLAEEWGLLGCVVVLLLYLTLLLQAVKIAVNARDLRGTLLCTGIVAMLTTQIVFNVGMTSGMLPVTGITLPLLSYGGSSILTIMICVGILLNIRRESSGF